MKALARSVIALAALVWTTACDVTRAPIAAAGAKQYAPAPAAPEPEPSAAPMSASTAPPVLPNADERAATINRDAHNGCDASGVRRAIAQELFRDNEFRGYICEETPCSADEFLEGLTFREVILRDTPRTSGCIVGPLHEAMTRIYGVFVLSGQTPSLALTYTGIDISVDPASKKPGFKDLVGTERLDAATWVTHRYVWKNRGYALESTTQDVESSPAPIAP